MPAAKGSARTPLRPIPKIVATFVYASSQGQRTHSTRTNLFWVWHYIALPWLTTPLDFLRSIKRKTTYGLSTHTKSPIHILCDIITDWADIFSCNPCCLHLSIQNPAMLYMNIILDYSKSFLLKRIFNINDKSLHFQNHYTFERCHIKSRDFIQTWEKTKYVYESEGWWNVRIVHIILLKIIKLWNFATNTCLLYYDKIVYKNVQIYHVIYNKTITFSWSIAQGVCILCSEDCCAMSATPKLLGRKILVVHTTT